MSRHNIRMNHLSLRLPSRLEDADFFSATPTSVFQIENPLTTEAFSSLLMTFPSLESEFRTHVFGEKKYLQNSEKAFWSIMRNEPDWSNFCNLFLTDKVVSRLYHLTSGYLGHRDLPETKPWLVRQSAIRSPGFKGYFARIIYHMRGASRIRSLLNFSAGKLKSRILDPSGETKLVLRKRSSPRIHSSRMYTAVEIGFEFSILTSGDSIPPHTDHPSKLLSLMMYFPQSIEQEKARLGTEFWRAKAGGKTWSVWNSGMPDSSESKTFYDAHDVWHQIPFKPNMICGFIKDDQSWHGLQQIDLEPGEERRAFIINVLLRKERRWLGTSRRPKLIR